MWLIRFHLAGTRDYNHVDRVCKKLAIGSKRFANLLLIKGVLFHVLEKKSWRKIAEYLSIPYLPLYHFYGQLEDTEELQELIQYFIERRIILWVEEGHITREYLESDEVIDKSLERIEVYII